LLSFYGFQPLGEKAEGESNIATSKQKSKSWMELSKEYFGTLQAMTFHY
jgi:hypothetical protein